MIRVNSGNTFIAKICNFIAMRFCYGFQNVFVIDMLIIKLFFDIRTEFITNSIISGKSSSSIKKHIHLVFPS